MKRTDSGLFIITLFVTGDHYNYTLGQTDIFVADWPRGRLHHWPEDAWGGVEHCCLFLLLQSLSHSGWRASPKRLTRSSKFSPSLCKTQTRTDRQITGDYRRDIFTSSHDPNVLNIHVSYRGDKSSWFIWSFHLYTLRFPFQRDSGCMGGWSSSRHSTPTPCSYYREAYFRKEMQGLREEDMEQGKKRHRCKRFTEICT